MNLEHSDTLVIKIVWDYFNSLTTKKHGVIPKSLPVPSTEPVLRKAAVDRGLRFSTEQYV